MISCFRSTSFCAFSNITISFCVYATTYCKLSSTVTIMALSFFHCDLLLQEYKLLCIFQHYNKFLCLATTYCKLSSTVTIMALSFFHCDLLLQEYKLLCIFQHYNKFLCLCYYVLQTEFYCYYYGTVIFSL